MNKNVDKFVLASLDDAARIAAAEAATTAHAWREALYAGALQSDHDQVWLYQRNQQLLGAAVLMQVLDEAHLQNFFIHASCHGQGLGKALLAHVMQQAREQQATQMFLEVRTSNTPALALYARHGFEAYAQRKGYYRNTDGTREDAILMKASL